MIYAKKNQSLHRTLTVTRLGIIKISAERKEGNIRICPLNLTVDFVTTFDLTFESSGEAR